MNLCSYRYAIPMLNVLDSEKYRPSILLRYTHLTHKAFRLFWIFFQTPTVIAETNADQIKFERLYSKIFSNTTTQSRECLENA